MSNDHLSPWSPSGHQRGWEPQPTYAPEQPPAPPQLPTYVSPRPVEVRLLGQPPQGRGLAITGVVLGGLALAGWLVTGIAMLGFFVLDDGGGGSAGWGTPRGAIAPAKDGALAGAALAEEVARQVSSTGGMPEDVTCPETTKVAQDVTTVCHGTDFGDPATFVVFFEDDRGAFTLLEI